MMTPSHREELILSHMPQVKLLAQRLHRRCPSADEWRTRLTCLPALSTVTTGLAELASSWTLFGPYAPDR